MTEADEVEAECGKEVAQQMLAERKEVIAPIKKERDYYLPSRRVAGNPDTTEGRRHGNGIHSDR